MTSTGFSNLAQTSRTPFSPFLERVPLTPPMEGTSTITERVLSRADREHKQLAAQCALSVIRTRYDTLLVEKESLAEERLMAIHLAKFYLLQEKKAQQLRKEAFAKVQAVELLQERNHEEMATANAQHVQILEIIEQDTFLGSTGSMDSPQDAV